VAVGTTTVARWSTPQNLQPSSQASYPRSEPESPIEAGRGDADVFLYPGHRFRIVDALLTNFHLPQSTLLMLCAPRGKDLVYGRLPARGRAGYRFYSYGDCMFVE